jgi:hypothetical protein
MICYYLPPRGRQLIIIEYIKMTLPLISHWTFPSEKKIGFQNKTNQKYPRRNLKP